MRDGLQYLRRRRGAKWERLQSVEPQPIYVWLDRTLRVRMIPRGDIARVIYLLQPFVWIGRGFEQLQIRYFASLLSAHSVVLDIGANAGVYSLAANRITHGRARVVAVEPSSHSFELLTRNIAANDAAVKPIRSAVADQPGTAKLGLPAGVPTGFGDAYLSLAAAGPGEVVGVDTIDRIVISEGLGELGVIKIDVEGWQLRALLGAQQCLTSASECTVIFENPPDELNTHIPGYSQEETFRLLRELGYSILRWEGKSLIPFGDKVSPSGDFVARKGKGK